MRVVHISDLHVGADRALAFNTADSTGALEAVISHLVSRPQPDCYVVTGDIAVNGHPGGYAAAAAELRRLRAPVFVLPGNHDVRESLMAALGGYCPAAPAMAPHCCYVRDEFPLRLVFMDSTRPGEHSGFLETPVAAWLEKTLALRPETPTLLFTHHPPFLSGLGLMDEPFANAGEFGRILAKNPQVRLCCGHLHRFMVTMWHGVTALTAPPLVLHIAPDFSPEGGDAFTLGAPAYLEHHLHQGWINTHYCQVPGDWPYAGPYSFAKPPERAE